MKSHGLRTAPHDAGRIELQAKHLDALRHEIERTGVAPSRLVAMFPGEVDVSSAVIYRWLSGARRTAEARAYHKVAALWRGLPDRDGDSYRYRRNAASGVDRIVLDTATLQRLKSLKERAGASADALLRQADAVPEGLTAGQIVNWLYGYNETVRRDHFEFVIALLESLPPAAPRIEITSAILAELVDCRSRSGLGPTALLRGTRAHRPSGLSAATIRTWLDGGVWSARADHLSYVLQRWARFAAEGRSRAWSMRLGGTVEVVGPLKFVRIDPEMRRELQQLGHEAGLALDALDDGSLRSPCSTLIKGWLSGEITLARRDHLEFVLKRWKVENEKRSP